MDLTPEQVAALGHGLEELARELEAALEGSAEAARPVELDQVAVGRVSRIDAIQQQKMIEANRHAQGTRLQLVRAALQRFREGDYGDCAGCGECIGFARLEVRPESLFCVACQGARERR